MAYKEVIIVHEPAMKQEQIAEQLALFWPDGRPVVPGDFSKDLEDIKSQIAVLQTQVKELKDKEPKR